MNVAGKWLSAQLRDSYGGNVETVLIEFCAGNVSPPKKTLELIHEKFELFLGELPIAEFQEKETEFRICTKLFKHYHDEIDRDSHVLSLRLFKNALNKSVQLLESTSGMVKDLKSFDTSTMAADIKAVVASAPSSLVELSELYLEQQKT